MQTCNAALSFIPVLSSVALEVLQTESAIGWFVLVLSAFLRDISQHQEPGATSSYRQLQPIFELLKAEFEGFTTSWP